MPPPKPPIVHVSVAPHQLALGPSARGAPLPAAQLVSEFAVSIEEAGRRLAGISRQSVQRLIDRGELETVRVCVGCARRGVLVASITAYLVRRVEAEREGR